MSTPQDPLTYRADEVAAMLRVGRNQVYQAIRDGEIPCIRVGRRYCIPALWVRRQLGLDAAA